MEKQKLKERKINPKLHITPHTSHNSGITLVALIITIIVLLILAVVAIRAVQGDGIITKAKEAKSKTTVAQEKEQIQLALNEWQIQKNYQKASGYTIKSFMTEKLLNVIDNVDGEDSGPLTVIMKDTENIYVISDDGTVTEFKGIILSKKNMSLTLKETATEEITATLKNTEGEITWSNSDDSVAKISGTTGKSITVTAVAKGNTTITATCMGDTETCFVTVAAPLDISKGSFVEYNVAYTDVYKSYEYASTNGWRLLDYTDNKNGTFSNVKLISTGIPARLYCYYNDTTNSSWYVTDNTQLTNFRNVLTSNGTENYNFYTGSNTYYVLQASAGMYYNFGDIKFAYGASKRGKSLGYFTKIASNRTTYDSKNTTETTGRNLFVPSEVNASVRLLTLPEMNKMLERTDIDSISTMSDPTGASGLFVLQNLKNVPKISTNTYDSGYYWIASPKPAKDVPYPERAFLRMVFNGNINSASDDDIGVRPVVCLSSNVRFSDLNGDGVLEIQQV